MSVAHKHIQRKSKYTSRFSNVISKTFITNRFDLFTERYNAKQKRKDRKIDDYYKHVQSQKTWTCRGELIASVEKQSRLGKVELLEEKAEVGSRLLASYAMRLLNERHDNMNYTTQCSSGRIWRPHAHFTVLFQQQLAIKWT